MSFSLGILSSSIASGSIWNAATKSSNITLSGGNLTGTGNGVAGGTCLCTVGKSTELWSWEYLVASTISTSGAFLGMATAVNTTFPIGSYSGSFAYRPNAGALNYCFILSGLVSCPCTPCPGCAACQDSLGLDLVTGDVLTFALNMTLLQITVYKNGSTTPVGGGPVTIPAGTWYPACGSDGQSSSVTANFGASPFSALTETLRTTVLMPAGYTMGIY